MKTYMASASTIERKWYVVDAADYTLGRLASQVAAVLRGKNKPTYTPFLDCGDNVIVINADKVKFTGKKLDQKVYYSHSDYVGGLKETTLKEMMEKKPEKVAPAEGPRRLHGARRALHAHTVDGGGHLLSGGGKVFWK